MFSFFLFKLDKAYHFDNKNMLLSHKKRAKYWKEPPLIKSPGRFVDQKVWLAAAVSVTEFTIVIVMILVTLLRC